MLGEDGKPGMEASAISITYAPEALEKIRFAAVEAFHSVPRGGLEIGGVLYGRRTPSGIEILAATELDCEHLFGPAFVLSENDEAQLAELLKLPQRDQSLKGLAPVGWFRSASRSALTLTSGDLNLHGRLFPEGDSVALILRPARARHVQAQFYYRTGTGAWESLDEFELLPVAKGTRPAEVQTPETQPSPPREQSRKPPSAADQPTPPIATGEAAPETKQPAAPPAPPPATPELLQDLYSEKEPIPRSSHPRWFWFVVAWLVAAGSLAYAVRDYWLPKPAAPLQVGLYDLDGQLTIGWERSAGPLRDARSGVLEILDGEQKVTLDLTPELIQKGTAIYRRQSGDVFVRMVARLPDGKALEGVARFSGPAPPPAAAMESQETPELRDLKAALEKQAARIRELENLNAALQKKLANSKR